MRREATTVEMNHTVTLDPLVLHLAQPVLDDAARVLAQPMGTLTEPFGAAASFGAPCDLERLIASAMRDALRKRGVEVDAVVHGLFEGAVAWAAGPKTIGHAWQLLPYENKIATLELTRAGLLAFARDLAGKRDVRNAMGLRLVLDPASGAVNDVRAADGSPLPDKARYRVALNSYDAQSGGQRLLAIARLAADPDNRRTLHEVEIRGALIDFFAARQSVDRASLLV
jgi:2',3'-cyclic-nucleotide 2'-phosphodiesterase (5'-nucleotidase family)